MSVIKTVPLRDIHSFHADENVSRLPGRLFGDGKDPAKALEDRAQLAVLMSVGWLIEKGGLVGAYPLTKEQQAAAVKELEARWKELKESKADFDFRTQHGSKMAVSASDILRAFEEVHVNGKGKIHAPSYGVVHSHRRIDNMPYANAIRRKLGVEDGNPIAEVPVNIVENETDLDRFARCLAENIGRNEGCLTLSNADLVHGARRMFQQMASEADLQRTGLKRGRAQQLHRLCQLDSRFPELGIIDSIIAGERQLGTFEKEGVKKLLDRPECTEEEVMTFIREGASKPAKIATRKEIEGLLQIPCPLVQFVARSILDADVKRVNRLEPCYTELNKAVSDLMATYKINLGLSS